MLSKQVEEKQFKEDIIDADISNLHLTSSIPKYEMLEESMLPEVAYKLVHQEMNLDGNPALNLATFVTTQMDEYADRIMNENMNKNYVDQDEYPQTTEIQNRCVNILANLFHAPDDGVATGTATIGSSEAIHLAGLALKWKWRKHHEKAGLPTDKPNIVMGRNVQICWEKFARYFDVEPRYVDLTPDRFIIDVDDAMKLVDQNTIAVVGILGSTLSGEFEPIKALNDALEKVNKKNGWDVGIHVDAASGGFVAPFVYPNLKWDFQLPLVKSINTSGHKFGLVYPGVGWVVWRDKDELPPELIFHVNYLGNDEPTFDLNFSKNAGNVLAQYYNFLRLGKDGYRRIMQKLLNISDYLTDAIEDTNKFDIVSKKGALPLVCFKLKDSARYTVFDISERMRMRGWIIPAYTMAPNAESVAVLRIVLRHGFNRDLAELLIQDLKRVLEDLETRTPSQPLKPKSKNSHHKIC